MTATFGDASASQARAAVPAETCPLCGTAEVQVEDVAWFAVEFDRRRQVEVEDAVVFLCRECGVNWD